MKIGWKLEPWISPGIESPRHARAMVMHDASEDVSYVAAFCGMFGEFDRVDGAVLLLEIRLRVPLDKKKDRISSAHLVLSSGCSVMTRR